MMTRSHMLYGAPYLVRSLGISFLFNLFILLLFITSSAQAQVTATPGAGSLSTQVNLNGNAYEITGGTRPGNGPNLFHSFGDFSIAAAEIARFQTTNLAPDATIGNILGRVTGGNPSSIFGTIDSISYYPSANLFLMNPAGIVFGPNAVLNVGGSVNFTTADYLRLTDGVRFEAIPSAQDALLSTASVDAFGFLGSNPAAIIVQGSQLTVANGTVLSLIGGDVTIAPDPDSGATSALMAPSGQINLVSVGSPGEVLFPSLATSPNINNQSFTTMGTVNVTGGSLLDVTDNLLEGDGHGGSIRIRGGQLVMDSSGILAFTTGNIDGASPGVNIAMQGDVTIGNLSAIVSDTSGLGRSGNIEISAQNITVQGGSLITTGSGAEAQAGQAGNISLVASDSVRVSGADEFGGPSSILSAARANTADSRGDSGSILIQAPSVTLSEGGMISTLAQAIGRAGDITVDATNLNILVGGELGTIGAGIDSSSGNVTVRATDTVTISGQLNPDTLSKISNRVDGANLGTQGDVSINARSIILADQGQIRSENFGQGGGGSGNVTLEAAESITMSSGARIVTKANYTTVGGINLSAPLITVDHATIFARSINEFQGGAITLSGRRLTISGASEILSSTEQSTGQGGAITIAASDTVSVSNGSIIRSSTLAAAEGPAGPITIAADNLVSLSGAGTGLFSESFGSGNGGAITIQSAQVQVTDSAVISAKSAGSGSAGSVAIEGPTIPAQSILIEGAGSGIFTETQGTGNGGNITTWANEVRLTDGATISSKTTSSGNAGDILVKTNDLHMSGGSTITAASTGSGNAGTITIQGINSPANSVLIEGAGTGLFTNTEGRGRGGDVSIDTRTLTMQNGGTISAATSGTDALATGGNISITASQSVDLRSNASISASSTGDADAGNISINAGNRFDARNSSVTTRSEHAGGGNIKINALDQIRLVNSQVNASAFMDGGNISIDPNLVILQNSSILARAIQGNGGNITIFTPLFLADSSSLVSASSQFGLNGTVTIQNPTSNLSGSLGTLATKPRQAQSLLTQRCAALANGQASSFVVAGREQLPADPGGWLTSLLALAGLDADPFREGTVAEGTSNLAPRTSGLLANDTVSLRRFTPAGFLMANYVDSEATGCHS